MKKGNAITRTTLEALAAKRQRGEDRTDWAKVDAMTDEKLEKLIAEDPEERDLKPDWTQAKLVLAEPKKAISLRMDPDVLTWFKQQGKGYQARIRAVLRAYMDASHEAGTRHKTTSR